MKAGEFYTVTSLNRHIKEIMDGEVSLRFVRLKGEISNLKKYPSGHFYFTLKDESSVISGVMFANDASHINFDIKDGDEVLAYGSVGVYPQRGSYQIYVNEIELFGQGAILVELEKLKQKLNNEGLFDESRKREIPSYPTAIGIISASGSAAIEDMIKNIHRRYPITKIYFFPSLVQGREAPKDLLRAFNLANTYPLSTLIIGRGGGASEDLNAFNDENLVRALANSKAPIISAIGHEIDFTLVDYVADKRVSTPTGAAELATPDKREIYETLNICLERMIMSIQNKLGALKDRLTLLSQRSFFVDPQSIYENSARDVKEMRVRLSNAMQNSYDLTMREVKSYRQRLEALSPYGVLKRGYSIMTDVEGRIIDSINKVEPNQRVITAVNDGIIESVIASKEKKSNG
ncbi:MAG: exodeoxyribonuclease VII large subunit [Bacilli bacterium]|mgnify:CR=1 FL=1|jgi:exodeoxyribonuclease VII large subunit|nr:exodeoxyribonuclease VII large subunit [Bacilli bacterium]MDD4006271.1 exodeoxyribonuclease VII large subunit [Bacilli bacterium]